MSKMKHYKTYNDLIRGSWRDALESLELNPDRNIIIFGAGFMGEQLLKYAGSSIVARIVGFCDNNNSLWGTNRHGMPIRSVDEWIELFPDAVYVIATYKYGQQIADQLSKAGVADSNILILGIIPSVYTRWQYLDDCLGDKYRVVFEETADWILPAVKQTDTGRRFHISIDDPLIARLDANEDVFSEDLIGEYEEVWGKYRGIGELDDIANGNSKVRILTVCSHKDTGDIQDRASADQIPIQVGKALTDIQLYELTDDTGINISERNYNFSECTALYWMWKNEYARDCDYIGIQHYRRKYDVSAKQLADLGDNNIDIIHLEPVWHNDIREDFSSYTGNPKDWELMRRAIRKLHPEYADTLNIFESQHFMCTHNMTIMRRGIFDEYCEFMFDILLDIEYYYLQICDRRDRYLGFIAEILTSLFILHHKDTYRYAICDYKRSEGEKQ